MKTRKKFPAGRRRRNSTKKRRHFKFWRTFIFLAMFIIICFGFFHGVQFCYIKAANLYSYGQSAYLDYKIKSERADKEETAKKAKRAASKAAAQPDNAENILLIGVNDLTQPDNVMADALILLNINKKTGALTIICIPRNTAIPQENKKLAPLGSLQQYGTDKTLHAVSELLDFPVEEYVLIDEKTLQSLLDNFGGTDLYVEENMNYDDPAGNISIHLNQGYQHLDGAKSLQYLTYRGDDLGDLGRAKRQGYFLKTFYGQIFKISSLFELPSVKNTLNTVFSNTQIFSWTNLWAYNKIIWNNSLTVVTLPGKYSADGLFWQPDSEAINELMEQTIPSS